MSDNLYFEPASRLQLVDKLTHLLRFSNTFLVLAGPSGSGLTSVVEQLHNRAIEDDLYILSLDLKGDTDLNGLLKLLNDAMDELVSSTGHDVNDQLSILHQKIETIANLQRKLLISIDNADYLTDEAAQSLLNLLVANEGKVSVTVAGSSKLATRTSQIAAQENLSDHHHLEVLNPFSRLETEEFIHLRFVRGNDFSRKQLSNIYLNTEGHPGRIVAVTSQMIKSGKIKLSGKSSLLPLPHSIGIALLLTAITGVLSWQSLSDDSLLDENDIKSKANELVLNINETTPLELEINEHTSEAQILKDQIANLSNEIKAQEALINEAKNTENSEFADVSDVSLIDSVEVLALDNSVRDRTNTVEDNVSNNKVESAAPVIEVVASEIIKNDQSTNKAKNASAAKLKALEEQAIAAKKAAQSKRVSQQLKALSAQLKININPQMLLNTKPVIESKNGIFIQENSINKTVSDKKAQLEAVRSNVATKSEDVTSAKKAAILNTSSNAIKNWPDDSYTLQLVSARSKDNIAKFLQTMPSAQKMHYVEIRSNGKPWHVVIYGQYANRSLASAAISKLPSKLKALKPWAKSVRSVKNSLK